MIKKIQIKVNFFFFKIPLSLIFYNDQSYSLVIDIMANYIERLKNKIKIKKFDSDQPVGAWIFVLVLNMVGFAGYFYLKINHIQLGK